MLRVCSSLGRIQSIPTQKFSQLVVARTLCTNNDSSNNNNNNNKPEKDNIEYKSLRDRLRKILSAAPQQQNTENQSDKNSKGSETQTNPENTQKNEEGSAGSRSIHQRLSDILSNDLMSKLGTASSKEGPVLAPGKRKQLQQQVQEQQQEQRELRRSKFLDSFQEDPEEIDDNSFRSEVLKALSEIEAKEFPTELPVERIIQSLEEADMGEDIPDPNQGKIYPKGVRGLELKRATERPVSEPLTEAQCYHIARKRIKLLHGNLPTSAEHKLVENEVRRLKEFQLSPAAVTYYRRVFESRPDKYIPRGHPRARGLCQLSGPNAPPTVHENVNLLAQYITFGGQIKPGRITGVSSRMQRKLTKAIKRSRVLALTPYLNRLALPHNTPAPISPTETDPFAQARQFVDEIIKSEEPVSEAPTV